jgi:hypothetical protein
VIGWLKYCLLVLFVAAFGEFTEGEIVSLREVTSLPKLWALTLRT